MKCTLARLGATEAASEAYDRVIGLEPDPAVRRFLQERRAALKPGLPIPGPADI